MMVLKLDTKALENLLKDDDGSFKLELQQAVLEEFGRRHIKAFANEVGFERQLKRIKQEAVAEIEEKFGKWEKKFQRKDFVLNQPIKDAIQNHAKTVVTYEFEEAEKHVAEIYEKTAQQIKDRYEEKVEVINKDLEEYTAHLQTQVENIKTQLITEEVDGIIRNHVKSILAESFGANN